jgi:hypothetical protein
MVRRGHGSAHDGTEADIGGFAASLQRTQWCAAAMAAHTTWPWWSIWLHINRLGMLRLRGGSRDFDACNGMVRRGHGSAHDETEPVRGHRDFDANYTLVRRGHGNVHDGTRTG